MIRRPVAGVVKEENGSGSGHDEHGGSEDENGGESDDEDEIVLEVKPELVQIPRVHLGELD